MLYRLACFGVVTSAYEFRNGPGSRLQNGGHGTDYQPILDLSETLIAHELGENSTALKPFARIVSPTNGTSTSEPKDIFKRQDNRPVGALKCSATEPCIGKFNLKEQSFFSRYLGIRELFRFLKLPTHDHFGLPPNYPRQALIVFR